MKEGTGFGARFGRVLGILLALAGGVVAAQAVRSAQPKEAAQILPGSHLVGVRAELDKNLSAKKARSGDEVVAKPEAKVQVANGVELATSSRLIGRVDTVKPLADGSGSSISVTFYEAELKDGRKIPIKATILWIGEPPNTLNPTLRMAPADRSTPGVGVEAGDTQTPPNQGYQGAEIAGMPHHPMSRGGSLLPPGLSSQNNALPGVNFFSDIGRSDSGWFRSAKKNVFVPGGTVMAFAIVALGTP